MKRLAATTVLLGVMVLVFLIPVALLFVRALALILNYTAGGIGAGTGGCTFSFSPRAFQTTLFVVILLLAALVSWLTQKILRRQNSRR